jgi:hypothetical protein
MELQENEFYCDVQLVIPHDDIRVHKRLMAWLAANAGVGVDAGAALRATRTHVLCRLNADGTIAIVGAFT